MRSPKQKAKREENLLRKKMARLSLLTELVRVRKTRLQFAEEELKAEQGRLRKAAK